MQTSKQERKIEIMARRFFLHLQGYEFVLYPSMLIGASIYYNGKIWGGSLMLVSGLIQAMVYMALWYHPEMGIKFRFASMGLSFGLLGIVFNLLRMQSDNLFMVLGLAGLLSALVLYLRQGFQQTDRGIIYRLTLMLLGVLALGLRLLGLF